MPSPKKPKRKVAGAEDPGPKDVKQIHSRIDRAGWEALDELGSDRNLSMEAMIVEALNDYLKRHSKRPKPIVVIERRTGSEKPQEPQPGKALADPITGQVELPLGAPGKVVGKRGRRS
ncbi:hypothetical protein [Methylobacterium sp. SI9]|uniref:hypothetical protein n=1 Tax=Methylobacterium guangdongense TaxID=3138811 RepID=UPI00313E5BAE